MELSDLETQVRTIDLRRYFGAGGVPWSRFTGLVRWPFAEHDTPRTAEFFQRILGRDPKFSDLLIRFSAIAVDLNSARILVYSKETTPKMAVSEAVTIAATSTQNRN